MVSTEVIRAGVRVAVAFLLSEISTLLEKGEEKEICLCKELDYEKESARCIQYAYNYG
jgi:hypothetical protein